MSTIGDKYKIGIFQKDKLKKVVTLNVSNDLGEKALNSSEESYAEDLMAYQIQNGHLNVIADAESVQLSWMNSLTKTEYMRFIETIKK